MRTAVRGRKPGSVMRYVMFSRSGPVAEKVPCDYSSSAGFFFAGMWACGLWFPVANHVGRYLGTGWIIHIHTGSAPLFSRAGQHPLLQKKISGRGAVLIL